jgi:acetate kinase
MADAIVVLNAGSSSLKFSLFLLEDASPALRLRGQVEGLNHAPKFSARDAAGALLAGRD